MKRILLAAVAVVGLFLVPFAVPSAEAVTRPVRSITSPNMSNFDDFGISLATAGNLAVTGSWLEDVGAQDSGSAFVHDATTGALVFSLHNPAPVAFDHFGYSVAAGSGLIVVGAPEDNVGAVGDAVNHHAACAADSLAAVGVKGDRILTLRDKPLVDDIEHLEEGHVRRDMVGRVVHQPPLRLRSRLPPDPQVNSHATCSSSATV